MTLTDSNGTIATLTTPAVVGNAVVSGSSITVTVTNWAAVGIKISRECFSERGYKYFTTKFGLC